MDPFQDRRKKLLLRADVNAIRILHYQGQTAKDLSRLYGVSPEHISLIVKGYRRAQVTQ